MTKYYLKHHIQWNVVKIVSDNITKNINSPLYNYVCKNLYINLLDALQNNIDNHLLHNKTIPKYIQYNVLNILKGII